MDTGQLAVGIRPLDFSHENILIAVHVVDEKTQSREIARCSDFLSFLKMLTRTDFQEDKEEVEKEGTGIKWASHSN